MFQWLFVVLSARRIGLRDNGEVGPYIDYDGDMVYDAHTLCDTRLRIGVDAHGVAKRYCWRCEKILHSPAREDRGKPVAKALPKQSSNSGGKLLYFRKGGASG